MIFSNNENRSRHTRPSWSGAAFIIEAMLLLVFLIGSLAVFTQLFATAAERGSQSGVLTAAVMAAENTAERFAVDPSGIDRQMQVDDLQVICDVTDKEFAGGTLYHADIAVFTEGSTDPVYVLSTSSYESEVG